MNDWKFLTEEGGLEEVLQRAPLDDRSFSEWLADILAATGKCKSDVVRESELNPTFAYQIFAGSRRAARNKLLQLAFGLELNIRQTNELLERGGVSSLSPHNRRDVVVAFCREHGANVPSCDNTLARAGEEPLRTR